MIMMLIEVHYFCWLHNIIFLLDEILLTDNRAHTQL